MTKFTNVGKFIFSIAIIGFGLINLISGTFPTAFMPPIGALIFRLLAVYGVGIILVSSGFSILFNKYPKTNATIIFILFLIDLAYFQLTALFADFKNASQWTVTLEVLAICSGAIILADSFRDDFENLSIKNTISRISKVARYTFAISLLGFGILHYMYADFIATLIPTWMPGKLFLNYIVMFGFVAAAVSFITNILSKAAGFLLGLMFLIWVVTLHLPRSIEKPTIVAEWSSLFIALAISGIGFLLANTNFGKKKD